MTFHFTTAELAFAVPAGVVLAAAVSYLAQLAAVKRSAVVQRELLTESRRQAFDEKLWERKADLYAKMADIFYAATTDVSYLRDAFDEWAIGGLLSEYKHFRPAALAASNRLNITANELDRMRGPMQTIASDSVRKQFGIGYRDMQSAIQRAGLLLVRLDGTDGIDNSDVSVRFDEQSITQIKARADMLANAQKALYGLVLEMRNDIRHYHGVTPLRVGPRRTRRIRFWKA